MPHSPGRLGQTVGLRQVRFQEPEIRKQNRWLDSSSFRLTDLVCRSSLINAGNNGVQGNSLFCKLETQCGKPLLSGEGVEKWPRAFCLPKSVVFVVF